MTNKYYKRIEQGNKENQRHNSLLYLNWVYINKSYNKIHTSFGISRKQKEKLPTQSRKIKNFCRSLQNKSGENKVKIAVGFLKEVELKRKRPIPSWEKEKRN